MEFQVAMKRTGFLFVPQKCHPRDPNANVLLDCGALEVRASIWNTVSPAAVTHSGIDASRSATARRAVPSHKEICSRPGLAGREGDGMMPRPRKAGIVGPQQLEFF